MQRDDLRLQQWYYFTDNEKLGPVSTDDLADALMDEASDNDDDGEFNAQTLIASANNENEKKPLIQWTQLYNYIRTGSVSDEQQQQQSKQEEIQQEPQQQEQEQQQQSEQSDMEYVEQLQTYVNKNRTLMYNYESQQWVPITEEAKNILSQQSAYEQPNETISNQTETAINTKKRKADQKKYNASIYVTNLPQTCTIADIAQYFSKCGVIQTKEGYDGKEVPMIKPYYDKDTETQLEAALVTYLRPESVNLAVMLLDDTDFNGSKIKVEEATFSEKANQKRPQKRKKNKKSASKKIQWGFTDEKEDDTIKPRVLILKNMFQPSDAVSDPNFFTAIKEDITGEISKLAAIDRVKIHRNSKEGIVEIKFKKSSLLNDEAFTTILTKFNGRHYAKKKIEAFEGTGNENWEQVEDDEEERHEAFGASLDQ
jgi:HIV Tat-specific factor 1